MNKNQIKINYPGYILIINNKNALAKLEYCAKQVAETENTPKFGETIISIQRLGKELVELFEIPDSYIAFYRSELSKAKSNIIFSLKKQYELKEIKNGFIEDVVPHSQEELIMNFVLIEKLLKNGLKFKSRNIEKVFVDIKYCIKNIRYSKADLVKIAEKRSKIWTTK